MRLVLIPLCIVAACFPIAARGQAPPTPEAAPPDVGESSQVENTGEAKKDEDVRSATESLRRAANLQYKGLIQSNNPKLMDWLKYHQATEKGAWIGISTSPAAPALRRQLKLPDGTGLVVDFVQPKSPADEAGVKQYDLLEKLDDQLLINGDQFAVLVRTFKAGDEVKLSLMREGKRQTVAVKLAEHEVPRLTDSEFFQPVPVYPAAPSVAPPPGPPDRLRGVPVPPTGGERSLTWLDGKQALTITTRDGHVTLTATDGPSGKVMYSTSIDTPEQRATLPKDVQERLSRLKLPSVLDDLSAQNTPQKPKGPYPEIEPDVREPEPQR